MRKFIVGILALASACLSILVYADEGQSKVNPKALAHYILAVSDDFNGSPKDAIREYERSVSFDNAQPLPHLRLATYYARVGLLEQSVKQLKTVLKLQPQNSQAHYLLALVYSSLKKYDLASQEYEHILKTASKDDPDNLEIHTYLAQLYFSQGKYPESAEQFNRILGLEPGNVSALYFLGSSYLSMHERGKAKEVFQKALILEPDHDGALNSLAYMDAEDGKNLDDALRMAHRSIDIDPSNGAYYDTLGWVLYKKGMYAESLMALQKAEVYIQDPIIYEHMGDVYNRIKEFALARKYWRRSLELDPLQLQIKAKIEELGKTSAKIENFGEISPHLDKIGGGQASQ